MLHMDNEKKNQNNLNEKSKFSKNKVNHTRIIKPLKANRNILSLIEYYIFRFLLINFIIIIKLKVSNSLRIRKLIKLNEIKIKIIGIGEQEILHSVFLSKPTEILVNGNPTNIDLENKISNLEGELNIITMKWDYQVDDCEDMFSDLTNLIEVDLSNFDGTKITTMNYMFCDCTNLESVNFTNLKTPSLIDMGGLFIGCESLKSADLSHLDTSSVINMGSIFSGCTSLTSVNLSNLVTSKVTIMSYLFDSCYSLTSIDLSNLDTSSVSRMNFMFSECSSLTSIDLSKFNTDSLEMVFGLFSSCNNLEYIDISNFDISKTTSLSYLFYGCQNLKYINFSNFIEGNQITQKVMFFDDVPNNITFCINNRENLPLIMEELNKRNCTINDCLEDWNSKQKLEITEKKICVYDCSEDNKYLYQFKNKCYETCPVGTILSSDNKLCLIQCSQEKPFELQEECVSDCKGIDFFNNECIINNKSIEAKETMIDIIENDIIKKEMDMNLSVSLFVNKKDLIVFDDTEIYQITSSFNQNNKENNKNPTINLGECEKILKHSNNINDDEALIIFKMEYYFDDFLIPITEYEIFNPRTKEKLELNICNNIKINITIPVEIDENIIYKYDPNSEYYKDKCFLNEDCGDDNILIKRKNEFNNNHLSLCEKKCEYIKYDSETKSVLCECEIKTEFIKLSEILFNKNNSLFIIPILETDIITNTYTNINGNSDSNIISSLITPNSNIISSLITSSNTNSNIISSLISSSNIISSLISSSKTNSNIISSSITSSNIISSLVKETTSQMIDIITSIYSYSKECLFIERDSKECNNFATLKDLFDKNYSPMSTKDSIDRVFELFNQKFKNKNINISNDEIIEGENVVFQMTTTQKQDYYLKNNLYNNISSIDLGECEKILQKEYKIDDPLIIIKVDIKRNDTVSTQIEYEVFNPYTLQKLNLSYCSNTKIEAKIFLFQIIIVPLKK